jgi:hypothetical protein
MQLWAWSKEVFYFEIKYPGLHKNPPQTRKKLLTIYSYTILFVETFVAFFDVYEVLFKGYFND